MALTRNKNNPNQINNIKFNGGKFVDQPMITEIDVGAVAPWISIIPIQPHISEIFLLIIIKSFLIILWFYHTFSHLSTTNFGEVGENRTLVNGFADQFLTTRTLPQKFLWILIAFIDCRWQLSFYPHALYQTNTEEGRNTTSHLRLGTLLWTIPTLMRPSLQSLCKFSQLNLLYVTEGNLLHKMIELLPIG